MRKRAPFPAPSLSARNPAAVRLGECAGDSEADPAAAQGACAAGVHAVETLEDPAQVLGGDALAGVRDDEFDAVAVALGPYLDPASRRGVTHSIVEEVREHLPDPVGVGGELRQPRVNCVLELHVLRDVGGLGGLERRDDDRGRLGGTTGGDQRRATRRGATLDRQVRGLTRTPYA